MKLKKPLVVTSYTEYVSPKPLDRGVSTDKPPTPPPPIPPLKQRTQSQPIRPARTSRTQIQSFKTIQHKSLSNKLMLKSAKTAVFRWYSAAPKALFVESSDGRQRLTNSPAEDGTVSTGLLKSKAKLNNLLKSQSRFLMSFSSFRIRLDSGSGEVAWERLGDMDIGAPEVLPMTADTGIRARYISISMLCSARRKPCE